MLFKTHICLSLAVREIEERKERRRKGDSFERSRSFVPHVSRTTCSLSKVAVEIIVEIIAIVAPISELSSSQNSQHAIGSVLFFLWPRNVKRETHKGRVPVQWLPVAPVHSYGPRKEDVKASFNAHRFVILRLVVSVRSASLKRLLLSVGKRMHRNVSTFYD